MKVHKKTNLSEYWHIKIVLDQSNINKQNKNKKRTTEEEKNGNNNNKIKI